MSLHEGKGMKKRKTRTGYQKLEIEYDIYIVNTAVRQGIAVFFCSTYSCLFPLPFPITYIVLYKSVLTKRSVCFFFCIRSPPANLGFRKKIRIGGKTVEISAKKSIRIREWQLSGDYISGALSEPAV